jgi:hypothetical protein
VSGGKIGGNGGGDAGRYEPPEDSYISGIHFGAGFGVVLRSRLGLQGPGADTVHDRVQDRPSKGVSPSFSDTKGGRCDIDDIDEVGVVGGWRFVLQLSCVKYNKLEGPLGSCSSKSSTCNSILAGSLRNSIPQLHNPVSESLQLHPFQRCIFPSHQLSCHHWSPLKTRPAAVLAPRRFNGRKTSPLPCFPAIVCKTPR